MQLSEEQIASIVKEASKRVVDEYKAYVDAKHIVNEGTWGVEPMDSDNALDDQRVIIHQTFGKIVDLFRLCNDLTGKWGLVGNSIEFAKALKDKFFMDDIKEVKAECLSTISEIEKDDKWLNDWKNPDEFRTQLDKTKKELDTVFEDNAVDGHDD